MADDNILEIGATINLASFLPGVDKMSASTRAATQVMAQSFQQLATTTLASTAQMTTAFTSVAPAAQVIPPAVRRVEASVHESTTAMVGDWRRLAVGVKESAVGIVESLTEVGAKMSETAERSRLGIGTMEAGFAGLAGILGAGIAVGFAADFLDETSRVLIELEHLNTTTGISVETLSGLRNVAQQAAVPFEALQVALVRMQRAQVAALEGQTTYTRAFHDMGISLAELKTLSPEQLFFKLATAMGNTQQSQIAVASGIEIMGRGMYTLLPLLQKYGGNLRQVTDEAAKQSGVTKEAVETAMKWHRETAQLSQMFQAFMVPVLEVVVNLLPRVAYAMGLVGVQFAIGYNLVRTFTLGVIELGKVFSTIANDIYGSGSIFDIPKHMQQAMNDLGRIAYDGLHRVTQNFSDARDMWDHLISRKPPKTVFEQAKDDMDELFKKPQGELDVSAPAKSDILQQWRSQLDQMRDAQTGFHELSKADEAAFWKDKLALAKNNVKLYREVYHEYVTAERAARKEALSEETSNTEEAVAQTKQGSVERIVILREELDHLRAIGAEETADYKRLQNQLLEAVRARTQQEAKAEEEKQKQAKQVALIDQDIVQSSEQSKLEIRRASLTTQASLGLISGRQRLEIDRQIITEEIALERQALEAKLLLYRREPVEYEKVKKELAALNEKYNRLLSQNNDEMLKMNLAGWLRFNQQVTTGFSTAVGRWIETGRGFGTALAQQWNQMVVQFGQSLARMLAQFALHELAKVVLVQNSETMQTAATATGTAARADAGLIADLKSIGRAAAVGAAHAFKWVMEEVPFPANVALAPAAAAAAFAGIMAFSAVAGGKAAKGGVLGEDGPVFAHAREMILPPPISIGLQNLVKSGGLNLPPALSQNFSSIGGSTSTSHTTTVHHNTVSPRIAVTVNGTSDGMADLHNTVVKTIKRALRNGQLNFNEV